MMMGIRSEKLLCDIKGHFVRNTSIKTKDIPENMNNVTQQPSQMCKQNFVTYELNAARTFVKCDLRLARDLVQD